MIDDAQLLACLRQRPTTARVALIGAPIDCNASLRPGAAAGPSRIRAVALSGSSNEFAEHGAEIKLGVQVLDVGDVCHNQQKEWHQKLSRAVSATQAAGLAPLVLGGDHSVTVAAVRGLHRSGDLTIVHFDAHPDLYDDFDGNPFSHASPMARIMEAGWAQRLVQIGIRTANPHQRAQAERFGVEMIEMHAIEQATSLSLAGPIYISFDLDALDPGCAPGVSHQEPGGLQTRQALALIQGIAGPVVGADIVELNPELDVLDMTATVAFKLVKELSALLLR